MPHCRLEQTTNHESYKLSLAFCCEATRTVAVTALNDLSGVKRLYGSAPMGSLEEEVGWTEALTPTLD